MVEFKESEKESKSLKERFNEFWNLPEVKAPLFVAKMIMLVTIVFWALELSIWFGVGVSLIALGLCIRWIMPVVKKFDSWM